MDEKRIKKRKAELLLINICCLLALAIVLLPLLMVARYNVPTADDWSFSTNTHKAVMAGGGIGAVLRASVKTCVNNYNRWEGRFTIPFLGSLQPGIWGEKYYGAVAWLMLGGLTAGEMIFFRALFSRQRSHKGKGLWFPVAAATLILQILYTPNIVESFYWYNGAVNYTFVYALSLVFLVLFAGLGLKEYRKGQFVLLALPGGILAVLIGGGNFSTSLSVLLTMLLIYIGALLFGGRDAKGHIVPNRALGRRLWGRTWFLPLLEAGSFLITLLAPGNSVRVERNFGGATTGNAVEAVFMSLVRSATNIYSWTNIKIILMLLLIAPFVWRAVSDMDYDFRLPGIFTLISFGVYASQIAPTMYVDGTTGGGRMAAMLYYSYHVWLVGNLIYWLGWLCRRRHVFAEKLSGAVALSAGRFLLPYCLVLGMILAGVAYRFDLKELSSYKAYRDWRQGWAQQYAAEWEERLEALHDESLAQVEFAPLSVCPETILYTDLQDENGYIWVNNACAGYYGKESVRIVRQETGD